MPAWIRHDAANSRWLLQFHVQPGARQTGVAGLYGERLKLKIAAPAVDNKANTALLRWLAGTLGVPRARLTLVQGATARDKTVALNGTAAPWHLLGTPPE
jgi:uncharacterized protein (TIGR00251 family)